ncbi:MAG TPA: hypothetical protein VF601_02155 [Beijerinckiaceae bacterium]|jgi:hypothetical protein
MGMGLDEQGREHIAALVKNDADGEFVRGEIARLLTRKYWKYSDHREKNREFVKWLRRKSYEETADYLERANDNA